MRSAERSSASAWRLPGAVVLALLWLCGVAQAATPSSSCVRLRGKARAKPLETRCFALSQAGQERTFRLYVPPHLAGPVPLILVLHGGGGSGAGMERLTLQGLDRIADREGAVVAYPDGVGKGWNDGRSDLRSQATRQNVDDVGFLRALVMDLASSLPIDRSRVYATGISNGGMMSYRLACDAADVFAAVAPVAADFGSELSSRCAPARPISIAIFQGTEDPIMPWAGGEVRILVFTHGHVISAADSFDRWRALDRCGDPSSSDPRAAEPPDGTSVVTHLAGPCAAGTEVRLYEIRGGGHTWPSGQPYLGPRLVGRVSHALDANQEIWSFLSRFRLPDTATRAAR
jgi:polyhydroxybutyrate depolymerase